MAKEFLMPWGIITGPAQQEIYLFLLGTDRCVGPPESKVFWFFFSKKNCFPCAFCLRVANTPHEL
jgi:hypothetical protein